MEQAVYNTIGINYDETRASDPKIIEAIISHLQPKKNGKYIDIGCGTGNYTNALFKKNICIDGIDISDQMLQRAKNKYPFLNFHKANSEKLPFEKNCYNGAIYILSTHHIQDLDDSFNEAYRVIHQGKIFIFTSTPEQMKNYWLSHYFPKMIAESSKKMLGFDELKNKLSIIGFKNIYSNELFVEKNTKDLFLQSGKHNPEIYLSKSVRDGISQFRLASDQIEIESGLKLLDRDIKSGAVKAVQKKYNENLADYLIVVGEKI
jgi:ubiquinone/menaquinone biosynthesis C-methylase UbiE